MEMYAGAHLTFSNQLLNTRSDLIRKYLNKELV